ncbi:hypothetical protein [Hydrogenophaga sp.]|uniref:hypothetical protein n=1 Tax=Hydrogenophaga sp. TaxID=1904254 RepID=UPI0027265B4A|nr:hypothetical protein [Hydrogenophaga sp.]MDO9436518.1 hypothetical protein [Hydrogenophaga sp.]
MHNKNAPPELVDQLFKLATLLTLTAAWMIFGMGLVRSGLGDSTETQIAVLAFVMVSIWLPVGAVTLGRTHWVELGAVASLIGILFPLLGLFIGKWAVWTSAGLILFITFHVARRRPKSRSPFFLKSLLGSTVLAVVLLSLGTAGRFFLPEEIFMGNSHSDGLFHIALASMIAKFHVPSIGADGLALTKYHFGSHFIAAGFANSIETRVSEVYVYWGTIALRVQLIFGVLWCNLHLLSSKATPAPVRTRVLLSVAFVGLTAPFFDSESFLFALAVFFGITPVISQYLSARCASYSRSWLQLSIILVGAFVCAAAKVSVGYFVAAILVYSCYSSFYNTRRIATTFVGLFALAICAFFLLHPSDVSLSNAGFGIIFASYLQYATPTTLVSFTVPLAILLLQFGNVNGASKTEHARGVSVNFHISYKSCSSLREFLNVLGALRGEWQMLCVSLAACLLVVMTMPIGSNAAYFSGVLLFMSFAMVPAGVFQLCAALARYRLFKAMELILLGMLGVHLLVFSLQFKAKAERVVACEACPPAANNLGPRQQVLSSLREHGTVWSTTLSRMAGSSWEKLVRDIEGFSASPPAAVVFVPPENMAFWKRLHPDNPYWCISSQLMIPAEIGVPMLRGIGPAALEPQCMPPGLLWYGFGRQQGEHRTGDFSDKLLCEMAVAKRFKRIYVLNSIDDIQLNRKLSCS